VLTGFEQPMGGCADAAGNVYIADYTAQKVVEYAHGKSKPIRSLSDAPDSPYGCAVDPTTGNLAVANDDGANDGNIAIWTNASGQPAHYTDATLGAFQSCAYDAHGDLLVTNGIQGYPYQSNFAWLPPGGPKLVDLSIPRSGSVSGWGGVYGVAWDGKYFTISNGGIYRIALLHGQAYYVGETELQYPEEEEPHGPYSFYIPGEKGQAAQVLVGTVSEESSDYALMWAYPAGGQLSGEISHGIDNPYSVTVSYQKHRGL
jgi:WD40 repeat protein